MRCALLLITVIIFNGVCKAEDDVRTHEIDGVPWVCFVEADARALLDMRLKFPLLQQKITLLEESVSLKVKQIAKLEEIGLLQDDQIAKLTQLNSEQQTYIENQYAWYRSGWFWAAVGVVGGAAITLVLVYEVH